MARPEYDSDLLAVCHPSCTRDVCWAIVRTVLVLPLPPLTQPSIMWSLISTLSCRIYLNIVREARRGHVAGAKIPSATSWTPRVPTFSGDHSQATMHELESGQDPTVQGPIHPQWEPDQKVGLSLASECPNVLIRMIAGVIFNEQ